MSSLNGNTLTLLRSYEKATKREAEKIAEHTRTKNYNFLKCCQICFFSEVGVYRNSSHIAKNKLRTYWSKIGRIGDEEKYEMK